MSGRIKEQWGKLTDDDLTRIDGKRDQLSGRIQERCGCTKEQAEQQMNHYFGRL